MVEFSYPLEEFNDEIIISDSPAFLKKRIEEGKAVVLLLTEENKAADFSSFHYALLLQEEDLKAGIPNTGAFAWADRDYFVKAYCRSKGIPLKLAETERLVIRELVKEDAGSIRQIFETENGRKYLGQFWEGGASPQDISGRDSDFAKTAKGVKAADEVIADYCRTAYEFSEGGIYAAVDKTRQEVAGLVSLLERSAVSQGGPVFWELGFALLTRYQGRGYGYEMCRALLDCKKDACRGDGEAAAAGEVPDAVMVYRRKNIYARVHRENTAARRLLSKLQFQPCQGAWPLEENHGI